MKIAIVSATEIEAEKIDTRGVDLIVSGVGTVATTFALTSALKDKNYDLVINIGVAGAYNRDLDLGDVFSIYQDQFIDFGSISDSGFRSAYDIGLTKDLHFRSIKPEDVNIPLPLVKGATSDTIHGSQHIIDQIKGRVDADIESMEGAAVFYCCNKLNIPVVQIRSISNYVEPLDRSKWKLQLAIDNLSDHVNLLLDTLRD